MADKFGTDGTPVHQQPADNSNTGRVSEPTVGRVREPESGRVKADGEFPTGRVTNDSLDSDWHERVEQPSTGRVRT